MEISIIYTMMGKRSLREASEAYKGEGVLMIIPLGVLGDGAAFKFIIYDSIDEENAYLAIASPLFLTPNHISVSPS